MKNWKLSTQMMWLLIPKLEVWHFLCQTRGRKRLLVASYFFLFMIYSDGSVYELQDLFYCSVFLFF